MRGLVLISIMTWAFVMTLKRPYIGVLAWTWLNFMSPHQIVYGVAHTIPWVFIIAILTITATIINARACEAVSTNVITFLFTLLVIQVSISTALAFNPLGAHEEWMRFLKTAVYFFMVILLINDLDKLKKLVLVIAFSIGFFGIKGGVFVLGTLGSHKVLGPAHTFISDNNVMALALLMILPFFFLFRKIWRGNMRLAATGFIVLIFISVLGSYSRGAMVAMTGFVFIAFFKSNRKFLILLMIGTVLMVGSAVVPQKWLDRMSTITSGDEDSSFAGRVNSWWFATNLAGDHPFFGGGARVFTPRIFLTTRYAPHPDEFHDAHSIYFEMLGEQGWLGLTLFLALFILGARRTNVMRKLALKHNHPYIADVMNAVWYSLLFYALAGTFLGLAYYDLPYTLLAITVICERYMKKTTPKKKSMKGRLNHASA